MLSGAEDWSFPSIFPAVFGVWLSSHTKLPFLRCCLDYWITLVATRGSEGREGETSQSFLHPCVPPARASHPRNTLADELSCFMARLGLCDYHWLQGTGEVNDHLRGFLKKLGKGWFGKCFGLSAFHTGHTVFIFYNIIYIYYI